MAIHIHHRPVAGLMFCSCVCGLCGLWTLWFVDSVVCGLCGLWTLWFVDTVESWLRLLLRGCLDDRWRQCSFAVLGWMLLDVFMS